MLLLLLIFFSQVAAICIAEFWRRQFLTANYGGAMGYGWILEPCLSIDPFFLSFFGLSPGTVKAEGKPKTKKPKNQKEMTEKKKK